MANLTMRYETILVFSCALGEEATSALVEKFKTLIAENATIEKIEEWGKRRLAYPINDETDGHYILLHFESKPDFPTELNRVLEITEGVLRSLIVRNEAEFQPAPPAQPEPEPAPEPQAEEAAPAEEAPAEEASVEEAPAEEAPAEEVPAEEAGQETVSQETDSPAQE